MLPCMATKVVAWNVCGEILKGAAHPSVPLVDLPLQGNEGIYILLMLCTARDVEIALLQTL